VIDLPQDRSLPGLSTFLDVEKMISLLSSGLNGALGKLKGCEISYIRYKPATSCLVAYRLNCVQQGIFEPRQIIFYGKLYTKANFPAAEQKTKHVRWVNLYNAGPVISFPDQKAIIFFYPNDCLIDGLKILSNPRKVRRLIYQYYDRYPEDNWRISTGKQKLDCVRYKPERRAVLRYSSRAINLKTGVREKFSLYLRFYANERSGDLFSLQQGLWHNTQISKLLAVPRPVAYLPERKLFIMESLPGEPLLNSLSSKNASNALERAAWALSELHQIELSNLPTLSAEIILDKIKSTALFLSDVSPEDCGRINEIAGHLSDAMPRDATSKCIVHGDFYYGQVLLQEHGATIIDFDRTYWGEGLADVGNFCAHLRLLGLEGRLPNHVDLESEFVKSYQDASGKNIYIKELTFWTALGLFHLSVGPFRRLEQNWRAKTGEILDECKRILQS
jgi:tRNA A-37 threonylcarbamoyl transferase component Bud32